MERLKQLKLRTVEGFRVRFKPSADQLADAKEYGAEFGRLLLKDLRPIQRAPKGKVRCDVCGAVFDEDEPVCPICKVGPEHFHPVLSLIHIWLRAAGRPWSPF